MASNVFYQFDEGKQNIMSTYDFSNHSQRQNGVGAGAALSSLHNKLFYQVSTITSALAEVMVNNGYDMGSSIESSWSATVTQLSNIVTKVFLKANHYTKAETQSYVTGLLALYDLSTVVDAKISAAISGINVEGGGATVANINEAINNAFNTAGSTVIIGGTTFYSKRATETEIQNGTGGNYVCPSTLKASKYVPILDPSGSDYLIYSEGGYWVRKAWATLSSGFVSIDTNALTKYYNKTYIDGNFAKKTDSYTKEVSDGKYSTPAEVGTQISSALGAYLRFADIVGVQGDPGYIKIPLTSTGGIVVQWGLNTTSYSHGSTERDQAITDFGQAPYVVLTTARNESRDLVKNNTMEVVGRYSSKFTFIVNAMYSESGASNGFYWITIGKY